MVLGQRCCSVWSSLSVSKCTVRDPSGSRSALYSETRLTPPPHAYLARFTDTTPLPLTGQSTAHPDGVQQHQSWITTTTTTLLLLLVDPPLPSVSQHSLISRCWLRLGCFFSFLLWRSHLPSSSHLGGCSVEARLSSRLPASAERLSECVRQFSLSHVCLSPSMTVSIYDCLHPCPHLTSPRGQERSGGCYEKV